MVDDAIVVEATSEVSVGVGDAEVVGFTELVPIGEVVIDVESMDIVDTDETEVASDEDSDGDGQGSVVVAVKTVLMDERKRNPFTQDKVE